VTDLDHVALVVVEVQQGFDDAAPSASYRRWRSSASRSGQDI
jgi:hypothetical protein